MVERAARAAQAFGAAADIADEAAATVFGINRTDLRIVGVVHEGRALTAGQVAAAAHLSAGATTTAIQRLVARGHLTRGTDPVDRRRAVVQLAASARLLIDRVYGPVRTAGIAELRRWSVSELELIAEFLERGHRFQLVQAERIRGLADQPSP